MKANEKDYQFLKVIRDYVLAHGYAPTVRELTKLSGYASTSTIHSRLQRLFFLGFLETDVEDYDGIPRAYRVKGLKMVEEYTIDEINMAIALKGFLENNRRHREDREIGE